MILGNILFWKNIFSNNNDRLKYVGWMIEIRFINYVYEIRMFNVEWVNIANEN